MRSFARRLEFNLVMLFSISDHAEVWGALEEIQTCSCQLTWASKVQTMQTVQTERKSVVGQGARERVSGVSCSEAVTLSWIISRVHSSSTQERECKSVHYHRITRLITGARYSPAPIVYQHDISATNYYDCFWRCTQLWAWACMPAILACRPSRQGWSSISDFALVLWHPKIWCGQVRGAIKLV